MDTTQIDAVITWVNGDDEDHRIKRLNALANRAGDFKNELISGRDKTRFLDNGELEYCIHSIHKFAPWIRKIHLVTDNQVPEFLTPDQRSKYNVNIVDHEEIFESYDWALPTFNTRTIETGLWRIPGLAPYFIYFNDDFIITKEVQPHHFFRDGKVVLRGNWCSMKNYGPFRLKINDMFSIAVKRILGITRSMHLLLQIRSAMYAGFKNNFFRAPHVPHPIRTQTLKNFFIENPHLFNNNIKYRFRNTDQFSAIFLAHHLEINNQKAVLRGAEDHVMINGEMDFDFSIKKKLNHIRNDRIRFVCLQGFEHFREKQKNRIMAELNHLLSNVEPDLVPAEQQNF
jgi:hypothetical protein